MPNYLLQENLTSSCKMIPFSKIFFTSLLILTQSFAEKPVLNQKQSKEVERIVLKTLKNNPKLVFEVLSQNPVEAKQILLKIEDDSQKIEYADLIKRVQTHGPEIFDPSIGVQMGNPEAPIKMAVFLDPNCGLCHRLVAELFEVIRIRPDLSYHFVNWDAFRQQSSEAVLLLHAIADQGFDRYLKILGEMVSNHSGIVDGAAIMSLAKGLRDINSDELDSNKGQERLLKVRDLTEVKLKLSGTPYIVIQDGKGNIGILQAMPASDLLALIKNVEAQGIPTT